MLLKGTQLVKNYSSCYIYFRCELKLCVPEMTIFARSVLGNLLLKCENPHTNWLHFKQKILHCESSYCSYHIGLRKLVTPLPPLQTKKWSQRTVFVRTLPEDLGGPLTHWGRVTHICVGNLTIIGSDNGLSPERRQAIIWTDAGILLIGPLGTNFSEILIEIQTFSLKKMRLRMSSAKCCSFRLGLNVLIHSCVESRYI